MDSGMASDAFASGRETQSSMWNVRRLRIDVALQAEKPAFTAQQEHPADRSVR